MKALLLTFGLVFLSSCKLDDSNLSVTYKNRGPSADMSSAKIENGALVIEGSDLSEVTSVTLKNDQGLEEALTIESKNSSRLVARAMSALRITAGAVFNLALSNAHGSTSFQIQVDLSEEQASAFLTRGDGSPDTVALSGTVSIDPAGTTVTGAGTAFTKELSRGDLITIEGESSRVTSITSDTSMTISKAHVMGAYGVAATYLENPVDVKDKDGKQIFGGK